MAPASTAASVPAVARPASLWQWMATGTEKRAATSRTTSWMALGSVPPLVSQRARRVAPPRAAAAKVERA